MCNFKYFNWPNPWRLILENCLIKVKAMEIRKIVARIMGKRNGYCEYCHRRKELERVMVSNYIGHPSFKYLCRTCTALERFKKYWWQRTWKQENMGSASGGHGVASLIKCCSGCSWCFWLGISTSMDFRYGELWAFWDSSFFYSNLLYIMDIQCRFDGVKLIV